MTRMVGDFITDWKVKLTGNLFTAGQVVALAIVSFCGKDFPADNTTDARVAAVKRALAAKEEQIATNVVTPCKDRAQAIVQPQIEHDKTCDCFASETDRQEQLARDRRMLEQALARCDLKGLDAQTEYIDERETTVRASLRDMMDKFRDQANAYASWGGDAERGQKEAQDKIAQMILANAIEAMIGDIINTDEKELNRRIDELAKHAQGLRDVRRVRTGELKELVMTMRQELAGKSKAEAKQIILKNLDATKLATGDVVALEKRLAKGIGDASVPRDDEPSAEQTTEAYLESQYATFLTSLDIAGRNGVKDARVFAKTAGLLAFAPDAIDTAAILYNASAIEDNISGLDKLRAAAERQREDLSAEMKELITQRQALAARRNHISQTTAP